MTTQADQDKLIAEIRAFGYWARRTEANPNEIDVWSETVPRGMVRASFVWGLVRIWFEFGAAPSHGSGSFGRDELGKVMRIAETIAALRAEVAEAEQRGRAAERAEIVATVRNRAELRRQQGKQATDGMSIPEALTRFNLAVECDGIADGIEQRTTPNTTEPTPC